MCQIGKTLTETFERLKTAFGNEALSWTQTYEWWKHFKDSQTSIDDNSHSGWLSISKTDDSFSNISDSICPQPLFNHCNLYMRHIATKFVPLLLNEKQKWIWVDVSEELSKQANKDDNFLKRHHYQRWDVGFWLWHWNKCSIISVGVKSVTTTEKNEISAIIEC